MPSGPGRRKPRVRQAATGRAGRAHANRRVGTRAHSVKSMKSRNNPASVKEVVIFVNATRLAVGRVGRSRQDPVAPCGGTIGACAV